MAKQQFSLDGGNELIDTLGALPLTVQKPILRRAARASLEPLAKQVQSNAPVLFGDLEESLVIGTKLNRRQAALNRADKADVEVHFGTTDPAGFLNEYGSGRQKAQPFFRSAWEGGKLGVLARLSSLLGNEIVAGAQRWAKRGGRR